MYPLSGVANLTMLSYQYDLPISKEKAIAFAKHILGFRSIHGLEESDLRSMISLIQDEEITLKRVLSLV